MASWAEYEHEAGRIAKGWRAWWMIFGKQLPWNAGVWPSKFYSFPSVLFLSQPLHFPSPESLPTCTSIFLGFTVFLSHLECVYVC